MNTSGNHMSSRRILRLGQQWPEPAADNTYWIGADPMVAQSHSSDGLVVLGRKCSSLEELEAVAAEIHSDLEQALADARAKFVKR